MECKAREEPSLLELFRAVADIRLANIGNNGNFIPNNKGADCQQCVPEPASQVLLSVVSDISDDIKFPEPTVPAGSPAMRSEQQRTESRSLSVDSDICFAKVGCGSAKHSSKLDDSALTLHAICKAKVGCGSAKHSSKLDDSALTLHAIPDDKIPQKSRGNGALYDNEAVYSPFLEVVLSGIVIYFCYQRLSCGLPSNRIFPSFLSFRSSAENEEKMMNVCFTLLDYIFKCR
jgi:hypothetical protein